MTRMEYDSTMDAIYAGKDVTKAALTDLTRLSEKCSAEAKRLGRLGRRSEAWFFKNNAREIRHALQFAAACAEGA